jgi:hypothetical protein
LHFLIYFFLVAAMLAMRKATGLHYKSCIAGPRFLLAAQQSEEDADCALLRRYTAVPSGLREQSSLLQHVGTPVAMSQFQTDATAASAATMLADTVTTGEVTESVREARSFKDSMVSSECGGSRQRLTHL